MPLRYRATSLIASTALLLTGCANITGAPRSVIPADQLQQLVTSDDYNVEVALYSFYSVDADDRGGLSKQDYRDMIAGLYLAAADANYQRFRSALGSSARSSAVGFDTLSLLLTGLAASSTGTRAEDLATAATVTTGLRTSIDRNLLFDRTIPAIIASMDAERARARAEMVERLRLDATAYPLPQFFADLQTYELSATLERAISRVNETANEDRTDAADELRNVMAGCDVDEDIADELNAFRGMLLVRDGVEARANVARISQELGLDFPATTTPLDGWRAIYAQLNTTQCRRGQRAATIARLAAMITAPAEGDSQ